jgi:hypothetical protein
LDNYPVWFIPLLFLLSGIVFGMRMVLKAHDLLQLFAGYMLGFLTTSLSIQVLFYSL